MRFDFKQLKQEVKSSQITRAAPTPEQTHEPEHLPEAELAKVYATVFIEPGKRLYAQNCYHSL